MSQTALVKSFARHFEDGRGFPSIKEARNHAAVILGVPVLPGTAQAKQVDEAIESSVIRAARTLVRQAATPQAAYQAITELYERQPPLTVRSSTSILNQAYSTPVPISLVASNLADIQSNSSVYEPCSGNGSLLIEADPTTTTVNELDPVRADALRDQGFEVTEQDAVNYVPIQQHDIVITNPPFGTVADDTGGKRLFTVQVNDDELKTNRIDHAIVLNSLKTMKPDGRAVFIIDSEQRGQARRWRHYGGGQNQKFFKLLYRHYNVTDHFTVSRKLYRKQGANVPIDMVVVQGRGRSKLPLPEQRTPRIYNSFEELGALIRSPKQAQRLELNVPMQSVDAIEGGLLQGGTVTTLDKILTISSRDGGKTFVLQTPMRTQSGGKYFLDYELLKATNVDFFSIDDRMECTIPRSQLKPTIEALLRKVKALILVDIPHRIDISSTQTATTLKQMGEWYRSERDVPLTQDLMGYAAINTARHLLENSGIQADSKNIRVLQGEYYRVEESPTSLTIHAKGRGVLVTLKNGKLTTNLTSEDIARFSLISERLTELVQQREGMKQLATISQPNNHNSNTQIKL